MEENETGIGPWGLGSAVGVAVGPSFFGFGAGPSLSWEEVGPLRSGGWPSELGSALWVGVVPSGRGWPGPKGESQPKRGDWPFLLLGCLALPSLGPGLALRVGVGPSFSGVGVGPSVGVE